MQLIYYKASILCQVVTQEQALADNVPITTAKRSRRGRVNLSASHHDSLREVKLRLYSDLDIHPMNMDCYVKGRLLADDDVTLQELGVASCDVINVVKVERVPDDDYASIVEWQQLSGFQADVAPLSKPPESQGKERGFVDTILVEGPSIS
jgi:hypothetical protein